MKCWCASAYAVISLVSSGYLAASTLLLKEFEVPNSLPSTTATGNVNDSGHMVGSFQGTDGQFHAFIRSADGQSFDIFQYPGSFYTVGLGINDQGDVVGLYSTQPGSILPYLRTADGVYTSLNIPLAEGHPISYLTINDSGQLVGYYQLDTTFHSFLCVNAGQSCSPLSIPQTNTTVAKAINNLGQVTGYVSMGATIKGFVLNPDGSFQTFSAPDATSSTIVTGINDLDEMVGTYSGPSGNHAFLLSLDGSSYLSFDARNESPGSTFPTGINGSGIISGYVQVSFDHTQGFEAVQVAVPEHRPLAPLAAGLLLLAWRRHRGRRYA
jgi:hypothetical protein